MQLTSVVGEVLYISSPEELGGLGFRPREMSVLYTIRPIVSTTVNVLAYPRLARRFATEQLFEWGVAINSTLFFTFNFTYGLFAYHFHPVISQASLCFPQLQCVMV